MSLHEALMKIPIDQRYQFIRKVYQQNNKDKTKTAKLLGIAYNTVSKAVDTINPQPRVYDTKVKQEHILFIYSETVQNPTIFGDKLAHKLQEQFGLDVNGRTVNLYRNQINLKYRQPIRSVLISDQEAAKRLSFTKLHIDNQTCWRNVVFSDEAWFLLGRRKKWVWVNKNNITKEMMTQTEHHPKKVLIWAAIGWNFKGPLLFFEKNVKTENYLEDIFFQ